jgi:hypothetical protein
MSHDHIENKEGHNYNMQIKFWQSG